MPMNMMHMFAIGDVYGCADLLEALLAEIKGKAEQEGFDYRLVFLGDIIDRGPDSRQAMELVIAHYVTFHSRN
uniref:Calcineurin-like phosphoesterase domain-containing protein n=1 Tax=Agrobacterium albertimagni TaxID=147266 RepID=A0A7C1T8D7_9HYPH